MGQGIRESNRFLSGSQQQTEKASSGNAERVFARFLPILGLFVIGNQRGAQIPEPSPRSACSHGTIESGIDAGGKVMESGALSLKLEPEIRSRLDRLAKLSATEPAFLAGDVLRQYLHIYERQYSAVVEGIDDADAGRMVDHDQIVDWIESWDTDHELEPPVCE